VKRLREIDSEFHYLLPHHSIEPALEARLRSKSVSRLVAPTTPSRLNARMVLQQGVFVLLGDPGADLFTNLAPPVDDEPALSVVKIEFPRSQRASALKALRRFNIGRDTLFPGLDGLAQSLPHLLLRPEIHQETLLEVMGRPSGWPGAPPGSKTPSNGPAA
jgi:hypothetical protein